MGPGYRSLQSCRCLLHKDVFIAEFLGIYQTPDSETPVQLYNGHLLSLRRYVHENGAKCNKDQLLLDTLSGLRYLHTKGLVHMELTLDTLTVIYKTTNLQPSN